MKNIFKEISVHFIGIGGIGMSGIAEVLLSQGLKVTGSDASESANILKLRELGARIAIGHQPEHIIDATIVVYSSAIKKENPEMVYALAHQKPLMKRAEMLAELMKLKHGIAIAGTHGKTTTTSFLATILQEGMLDPTYIIGGIVENLKGHARVGEGQYLVAEADESDGSFLLLSPIFSVITNIDNDHLDYYGSEEALQNAFVDFANRIPFYGVVALNSNDQTLMSLQPKIKRPTITFGIAEEDSNIDYRASKIQIAEKSTSYELWIMGKLIGRVEIHLPGNHNILNSLGALSIAHHMGLEINQIISSMKCFKGVGRRFQTLYRSENCTIIDDYGHHPTEIRETIKTAKQMIGQRELIVVFEPHRFTRTRDCWDQFLHCFNGADKLYLAPIYPASEQEIEGINTDVLVEDINRLHPALCEGMSSINQLPEMLKSFKQKNCLVVCMGAGTIGKVLKDGVKDL